MFKRPRTTRVEYGPDWMVRHRPGGKQIFRAQGDELNWAVVEYWPDDLDRKLAHSRNMERRQPLGDPENFWIKVGEYPLTWMANQVPMNAWEDRKALGRRVINNRDYRRMRADSNTRIW